MNVKTDTKEKFHVITLPGPSLTASMTDELDDCLLSYLQNGGHPSESHVKNLVIVLSQVQEIDVPAAEKLVAIQQQFYESNASFVICEIQPPVEEFLDKHGMLELMNVTPTESEAWDIVQMEEIEREFMGEEGE